MREEFSKCYYLNQKFIKNCWIVAFEPEGTTGMWMKMLAKFAETRLKFVVEFKINNI